MHGKTVAEKRTNLGRKSAPSVNKPYYLIPNEN